MPRSFDEFAADEGLSPYYTTAEFFEKHPDLEELVLEARNSDWPWTHIFDWLKKEYAYPVKSSTSIRKHMQLQGYDV